MKNGNEIFELGRRKVDYYRLYIFETRRVIEIRNNSKLYKSIDSKIIEIVVKNT